MPDDLSGMLFGLQREVQSLLASSFRGAVAADDWTEGASVLVLAAVFGMVHAIGPGHGKSVMVAFFATNDARARQALTTSIRLIGTHVGSAIVLVLVTLLVLRVSFGFRPADFPLVRQISYAGVIAVGFWLLIQTIRARRHVGQVSGGHLLPHMAGLSPCPLTTIIMVAASGAGALGFGLLVSLAMATGMVATVSLFSLVAILARRFILRQMEERAALVARLAFLAQATGAATIILLGVILFIGERA